MHRLQLDYIKTIKKWLSIKIITKAMVKAASDTWKRRINNNLIKKMTHKNTLEVMGIMDEVRQKIGLRF